MFQMESMHRRKGSGRLAELFGPAALERDKQQRSFEFEAAERDHYCRLAGGTEIGQYRLCVSDQCLPSPGQGAVPAVFVAAAHPRTLTGEDILLFCLGMFKTLNTKEEEERIRTLMEQALPKAVTQFLTPDEDEYGTVLVGGPQSSRQTQQIPLKLWISLDGPAMSEGGIDSLTHIVGSKHWAVGATKPRDGRTNLPNNDMHLSLVVPNIWYRNSLRYTGKSLDADTLAGITLLMVGNKSFSRWIVI